VFVKGDKIAASDCGAGFVHIGFRPSQIVALFGRAFGNALVDKLARRLFDQSPAVTWVLHHASSSGVSVIAMLYHKAPVLTGESRLTYYVISAQKKRV
jgi:hypothetical protein